MKINTLILLGIFTILIFFMVMFLLFGRGLAQKETQKASVLYSSPSNNSINIPIDKNLYIYLDQQMNNIKDVAIETSPDFNFQISLEKNTIKIEPETLLEKNKEYKITISAKNPENPPIVNLPFEINFKTGEIIETALKQDNALILKLKGEIPVFNRYFDLTYTEEDNSFAIIINSKNCIAAKRLALEYLKNNGLDPKNLKIKWYQGDKGNASCVPSE